MKIQLIAIGKNMPPWVVAGFLEYSHRLPKDYALQLVEITPEKRSKKCDVQKILQIEAEKIIASLPKNTLCIALDRLGKTIDTETLAKKLQAWHDTQENVSLVIGGPEGLAKTVLDQAQVICSLSALTLPHPLVRVLVAEQIYRAWSMINHHPYHR
ncbi:MAG: 23S rRNA (pseudouridine(1915)-N(3))-methyltransferase RlmH [Gammaproteobacteria bacterium RIFCSPLOWO2_02_FULL_42_14]|nr:MAG: 23S rRNA (pseudouridine(1915)-N(3))-methyltransferase RlmH [Gammaproteobacteria bacterium RIFCSPHIGHO2_02_FULL_42_43]OGT28649.1 MAG: 23S rRNA (pseudouridine(1915)-N(3))-methyltransferase RlmH [Gammaproteobacteria bacterium RIFCSPHIGHO2_01_FULL_42_8]OGT52924.1 MAG: 23S rRNA (pseudouridine(1915)-N(3))-methyltransferase RlmH [Gammaproteobacteria bacterium RIFCSPHIGHO2_12_FULL_41_25]OGT61302.1 MAG: 23S rRNA (pseudouridine(1915)-N(3))-methyltransferase RlmH [Gammaproteobacteria bacterium RIFC